jgi:hypothetical protein
MGSLHGVTVSCCGQFGVNIVPISSDRTLAPSDPPEGVRFRVNIVPVSSDRALDPSDLREGERFRLNIVSVCPDRAVAPSAPALGATNRQAV